VHCWFLKWLFALVMKTRREAVRKDLTKRLRRWCQGGLRKELSAQDSHVLFQLNSTCFVGLRCLGFLCRGFRPIQCKEGMQWPESAGEDQICSAAAFPPFPHKNSQAEKLLVPIGNVRPALRVVTPGGACYPLSRLLSRTI
jgi:hypothetical protein